MNWKRTLGSLVFFALGFSLSAMAQEVPEHEKKVFTDDDGTVYWNKALPVYIRLATEPEDGAPSELLKEDTEGNYVDYPYYFDTEGPNYIRTNWAVNPETGEWLYPRREVLWEVQADGLPPSSTIRFSDARPFRKDGKLYFRGEVTITLTSKDGISGVDKIYYSINGAPYQAYENPIELTESKDYTLKVYGLDRVGNVEQLQERNFVIDKESPQSRLEMQGDKYENVVSGRTMIKLSSTDDLSGIGRIIFQIDGGPETTYRVPLAMNGLAQGEHTIAYWAEDMVKNEEEHQTYSFYVDRDGPLVTQEILGDVYVRNGVEYVSGRAQVKLAAFDNKAGLEAIYYSTDNENYQKYEKPFYLNAEAQQNGISFYAVDKVNNRTSTTFKQSQDGSFANIDLAGPTLSQTFQGPVFRARDTVFISPATKIILRGTDPASGVDYLAYSLNGADQETRYGTPFSLDQQGQYDVAYFGYDAVGNRNRSEFAVFVDATAPEITFSFDGPAQGTTEGSPSLPIYPSYVNLFLSAQDDRLAHQNITYSINGASARKYTGPISGFGVGKTYEITVSVEDKLGNKSEGSVSFSIAE